MHLSKTLMYANNGLCCMRTKKAQAIHTAYVVQDTFSAGWFCLFVLLLYVIAGRSVHLTTLFPGQA